MYVYIYAKMNHMYIQHHMDKEKTCVIYTHMCTLVVRLYIYISMWNLNLYIYIYLYIYMYYLHIKCISTYDHMIFLYITVSAKSIIRLPPSSKISIFSTSHFGLVVKPRLTRQVQDQRLCICCAPMLITSNKMFLWIWKA